MIEFFSGWRGKYKPTAETFFLVGAVRRSGHHAVIDWLCAHYDSFQFFNNWKPPYRKIRKREFNRHYDMLAMNLERCTAVQFQDWCESRAIQQIVANSGVSEVYRVTVVRDPFNCLASQLKLPYSRRRAGPDLIERLKSHMRLALNPPEDIKPILFNEFISSEEYRRGLSDWLGRPFTDVSLQTVSKHGSDSSFNQREFDGRATEMNLFERWKEFRDDPLFKEFTDDDELHSLNKELFGFEIR